MKATESVYGVVVLQSRRNGPRTQLIGSDGLACVGPGLSLQDCKRKMKRGPAKKINKGEIEITLLRVHTREVV